jgi:hypothetical protein
MMRPALIMIISLLSFGFLEKHPWSRQVKSGTTVTGDIELALVSDEASPLTVQQRSAYQSNVSVVRPEQQLSLRAMLSPVWPFLLCQLLLAAFSFGVLPSVLPYVYKKYAVRRTQVV